jgi:hypothetical protein
MDERLRDQVAEVVRESKEMMRLIRASINQSRAEVEVSRKEIEITRRFLAQLGTTPPHDQTDPFPSD